jgi:hypothetical protein
MEQQWNVIDRENLRTRRKTSPSAAFFHHKSRWIDLCAKTGLRGEKSTTNRMSYGTANRMSYGTTNRMSYGTASCYCMQLILNISIFKSTPLQVAGSFIVPVWICSVAIYTGDPK